MHMLLARQRGPGILQLQGAALLLRETQALRFCLAFLQLLLRSLPLQVIIRAVSLCAAAADRLRCMCCRGFSGRRVSMEDVNRRGRRNKEGAIKMIEGVHVIG